MLFLIAPPAPVAPNNPLSNTTPYHPGSKSSSSIPNTSSDGSGNSRRVLPSTSGVERSLESGRSSGPSSETIAPKKLPLPLVPTEKWPPILLVTTASINSKRAPTKIKLFKLFAGVSGEGATPVGPSVALWKSTSSADEMAGAASSSVETISFCSNGMASSLSGSGSDRCSSQPAGFILEKAEHKELH